MTYEEARGMIYGNRRWVKWIGCLYLQKYRNTVRIRYGYRYRNSTTMAVWYKNGSFKFQSMLYYQSQRWRLNHFMPRNYKVINHRYNQFLAKIGESRNEARAFYMRNDGQQTVHYNATPPRWVVISKTGKVKPRLGKTLEEVAKQLKAEDHKRDLPRRKGRYWMRKARGIFRHPCGKGRWGGCAWSKQWPRPTVAWKGECGCEVYTKKAVSRDTVKQIMDELNATVRTSKIQIYGVDRFFNDAQAQIRDEEGGYQLLTLNTGKAQQIRGRWGREQTAENLVLVALRMVCSTTGKVYVNTVPTNMRTVRSAIDWVYNTENYLGRVGQQT